MQVASVGDALQLPSDLADRTVDVSIVGTAERRGHTMFNSYVEYKIKVTATLDSLVKEDSKRSDGKTEDSKLQDADSADVQDVEDVDGYTTAEDEGPGDEEDSDDTPTTPSATRSGRRARQRAQREEASERDGEGDDQTEPADRGPAARRNVSPPPGATVSATRQSPTDAASADTETEPVIKWFVWRRFSQFETLHNELIATHPHVKVDLPSKWATGTGKEVVYNRIATLCRYLRRLLAGPSTRSDQRLWTFLDVENRGQSAPMRAMGREIGKEGYVKLRMSVMGGWTNRYVVVTRRGQLLVYNHMQDDPTRPQVSLPSQLRTHPLLVERVGPHHIALLDEEDNVRWELRTLGKVGMNEWVAAIDALADTRRHEATRSVRHTPTAHAHTGGTDNDGL